MLAYRALVHGVIVLLCTSVIYAVSLSAGWQGVILLLQLVDTAYFLMFSLCAGAAMNRQRALIITIIIVALLLSWPLTPIGVVRILIPSAAGILLGAAMQRVLHDAQRVRRTHGRSLQSLPPAASDRDEYARAERHSRHYQ